MLKTINSRTISSSVACVFFISSIVNLITLIKSIKDEVQSNLLELRETELTNIIKKNDAYSGLTEYANQFLLDHKNNNLYYVKDNTKEADISGWNKFQILYLFYPSIPLELNINDVQLMETISVTKIGDYIISDSDLPISLDKFEKISYDNYYIYIMK